MNNKRNLVKVFTQLGAITCTIGFISMVLIMFLDLETFSKAPTVFTITTFIYLILSLSFILELRSYSKARIN